MKIWQTVLNHLQQIGCKKKLAMELVTWISREKFSESNFVSARALKICDVRELFAIDLVIQGRNKLQELR